MFLTDYNETCSTAELLKEILQAGFEPAATCLKAIFWVLCAIFHGHFALVALLATPPLRRVVLVEGCHLGATGAAFIQRVGQQKFPG